ncbi:MAG: hypothetical protein LBT09_05220 [Planctomycetaceae bacterium]|jgi:hypothetical protein|nr:hypothetical protein [Planctomycetaceae bacterium]
MNNQNIKSVLTSFRRRLVARLFWKDTIIFLAVFLFLWGIFLLTFRVSGFDNVNVFFMILPASIIVPLVALISAFRRIPNGDKLISLIDKENGAGGLVMSSFETDIGKWSEQIKELSIPVVHWIPNRTIGLFLAAILFATASLLLPVSAISDQLPQKLNINDQVNKLTAQLDTLKEEKILDQVEVQTLKRDLKMLQKEADGLGPIKTFDALDTLAGRMNHEAAKTVQDAERNIKSLTEAESLVRKVNDLNDQLDTKTSKALMEGLAESMENMLAENEQLADALQNEIENEPNNESNNNSNENKNEKNTNAANQNQEKNSDAENQNQQNNTKNSDQSGKKNDQNDALKNSLKKMLAENNMRNLSPEQMRQLADAMKNCSGKCERQIENLQKAGFPVDKDALKKLSECKRDAQEEAERTLSELWANCDDCNGCEGGEGSDNCDGSESEEVSPRYKSKHDWRTDPNAKPEKNRFQKTADEEGYDFKAEVLPAADLQAFKNSLKMGVTTETPTKNAKQTELNGGAIVETGGGTGSAHMQQIYPVHRKPVGRFFEK